MTVSKSGNPLYAQTIIDTQAIRAEFDESVHDFLDNEGKVKDENKIEYQEKLGELERELNKKRTGPLGLRVNIVRLFIILILIGLLTALIKSAGEQDWLWMFRLGEGGLPEGKDLTVILAPIIAIAVAIERLLETVFNWWEETVTSLGDLVGDVKEGVSWWDVEFDNAKKAVENAANAQGIEFDDKKYDLLEKAEQRLAKAELRLHSWVKDPGYVAQKRALSILIGILVGVEVAIIGNIGMLQMIGFPIPRIIDMLLTGFVIGAGPGPMHSLLGILQSGKDTLSNLASLTEGRAMKEAIQDVQNRVQPG